ncbi:DUF882 domain-containing protein [Massilia varians]|jgi:uncharacterized protein YcbK (DUF882 family)|uniref:DUF882 domain-containing protein n=1 Tax=Massilia TaxID=149698 RepID=UPI000417C543|nr:MULTISPECIES: DUF882 domain-containing protein [Massilia]KFC73455.1 putative secreted protein [Massilia sp. LC238]MDK6075474.1 DUF882 domain-containing protein [Massilia varians]
MMQRRAFLKSSLLLAAPTLSIPALAKTAQPATGERVLRLYNTHTGEKLKSTFWAEGEFIPDAMKDINKVLRDHRNNKVAQMDPELLLLLTQLNDRLENNRELHIISGYRSPESNAKLHAASGGVAKRSLHMDAKAIDIRLPGKDLKMLHKAAMSLKGGGVGYYASSQFVHMDTGRVRYW